MADAATPDSDPDASPADRTYLRVQPADEPLAPDAARRYCERLHGALRDAAVDGLLARADPPALECCLVTAGADDGVRYYLGVAGPTADDAAPLDALERTLRAALPRGYSLARTSWHPDETLGRDPPATASARLRARADRTDDWQQPLTPYAALTDGDAAPDAPAPRPPLDTALAHTRRLPDAVEYDAGARAVRCTGCDARYDPSIEGLKRAVGCCHELSAVDRDDVPVCDLNLKLGPAEVRDSDWTATQLLFLQAVYNAQQRRYSRLEYDLCADSMLRLQEYVGIDDDAVDELRAADLLRHDGDHPHRLYTVSPAGRDAIGEGHRSGTDYGHGEGDLAESSQHVLLVEAARRWLERTRVDDSDSPVVEAVPYYDLAAVAGVPNEGRRLDLAGLNADGDVVVAVEAERINHDVAEAVPADYDKMAACDPAEAVWVTLRLGDAHTVVDALAEPPDDDPRVEKTYADTTPPQQFTIDRSGLTDIVPVSRLLRDIERG